jgi:hypothetical protein
LEKQYGYHSDRTKDGVYATFGSFILKA